MNPDRFRDLLKRSSLGTPAAQANRASVPAGLIERILNRAEELERSQAPEQDTSTKPIATSTTTPQRTEERCRIALSCVFIDWEFRSTLGDLLAVDTCEQAPREVAASEAFQQAYDAVMQWSGAYRSAPPRRGRVYRLGFTRSAVPVEPPAGSSQSEKGLYGIARWAWRLLNRERQPWRVRVDYELGTGKSFMLSSFYQLTVPSVERAARLLIHDSLEDDCVNEVVATALAEASNRWRWLAAHPAPMTWTVRTALQALDPTIAARQCGHTAEPIIFGQGLSQRAIESLWRMPTHQREVIGLWATCGFESNQIAHVLDLPEREVRHAKDQALRQMQATDPCCQ